MNDVQHRHEEPRLRYLRTGLQSRRVSREISAIANPFYLNS